MNLNEIKLNKSHSESDLYKSSLFDTSSVGFSNSESVHYAKGFPLLGKSLYFEEVIEDASGVIQRRTACISTPNLHDLKDTFKKVAVNMSYQRHSLTTHDISEMDIDVSYDNHEEVEKDPKYFEAMETDLSTSFSKPDSSLQRFDKINDLLKKQSEKLQTTSSTFKEPLISECDSLIVPLKTPEKKLPNLYVIFLLIGFGTLFCCYFFQYDLIFVNSDVQLENLRKDLKTNVFEQKNVVNSIIRSLEDRKHWQKKIKTLTFVGPRGVGKTHVTNIIKKHFHKKLVHELYGSHLSYKVQKENILNSLKDCCLNLIIIDDLKKQDEVELFAFIHSLPLDHFILVLTIFDLQDPRSNLNSEFNYEDIIGIHNNFNLSGIYFEMIVFDEFNEAQVRDWLKQQLITYNVSDYLQEPVINNILKTHDVKIRGLKGLDSKIMLELKQLK